MSDLFRAFLIFGPPGSGKGTQSQMLAACPCIRHISTGEILRGLDPSSPLGKQIKPYMDRGEFPKDELVIDLFHNYLKEEVAKNKILPHSDLLLLDGVPRNVAQTKYIAPFIEVKGVISIEIKDFERLALRIQKRAQKENRQDDTDIAILQRRFEIFNDETKQVLNVYPPSLIHHVDGLQAPILVFKEILNKTAAIIAENTTFRP